MKKFLDKNFILENATAEKLYHEHAAKMPIIDYHCHLSPEDIANDRKFENLTKVWLDGDHYKWRAMRTNGIDEKFITGSADDFSKFEKWAETVPYTMPNPLYHWTHMELQKPFKSFKKMQEFILVFENGLGGDFTPKSSHFQVSLDLNPKVQLERKDSKGLKRKLLL